MPHSHRVEIRTESITLGALLKWAGVVGTGGEAKTLIATRRVLVNEQIETRRGRRVVSGDVISIHGGPSLIVTRGPDVPPAKTFAPDLS